MTPRWQKHLERILARERDVDAVVVFTVPMSHFRGIPEALRDRFSVPVVFYDGDVPMSLPEFGGMDTGFNYYHGADPGEYDLVVSNSEGGLGRLRELGARRAEAVFWGADPELFQPLRVDKQVDVFFYGYGDKFRRDWMEAMVGEPSRRLQHVDFALGGRDFLGDIGAARELGDVPFNVFGRAISEARINLNITRRAHASVRGLVDGAPVRAGHGRRGHRLEPVRGDRALVRAGSGAARRVERGRGDRRVPRAARRPRAVPTSSAALRASARSTSTRTSTARGGCSSWSGSARRRRCRPVAEALQEAPSGVDPRLRRSGASRSCPRYNEEGSIGAVIDEIRAVDPEIEVVVVDDGSRDRTAEAARAKGARVLELPFNLGIGGAVQTGYRYAHEHGFDLALRVDGDGQHDPAQFLVLAGRSSPATPTSPSARASSAARATARRGRGASRSGSSPGR